VLKDHGPFLWGLLFAFGLILFSNGLFTAFETSNIINPNGTTILAFPKLYFGMLISITGLIITIVGYLE